MPITLEGLGKTAPKKSLLSKVTAVTAKAKAKKPAAKITMAARLKAIATKAKAKKPVGKPALTKKQAVAGRTKIAVSKAKPVVKKIIPSAADKAKHPYGVFDAQGKYTGRNYSPKMAPKEKQAEERAKQQARLEAVKKLLPPPKTETEIAAEEATPEKRLAETAKLEPEAVITPEKPAIAPKARLAAKPETLAERIRRRVKTKPITSAEKKESAFKEYEKFTAEKYNLKSGLPTL